MVNIFVELSKYWEMLAVTSLLPFASLIALLLRRDIMKGKVKILESTLNGRECDVLGASVLAWNVKEYYLFK